MRFLKPALYCSALIAGAYAVYHYQSGTPQIAEDPEVKKPMATVDTDTAAMTTTVNCQGFDHVITNGSTIPKLPDFSMIPGADVNVNSLQCSFDSYSWDLFLALNHDAAGDLVVGGSDDPTVWESWAESSDIFLKGGVTPVTADGSFPPRHVPEKCQALHDGSMKIVRQIGKRPDVLEEFTEPFQSGPLIDANGHYSRFAISVNQSMFDYILDNKLYNKAGQKAFSEAGNEVNFQCSCNADPSGTKCTTDGQQGAVMAKAAWKVIDTDKNDDPTQFHTVEALVYTEASKDGQRPEMCEKQLVGLTGFHIGQKTSNDTQWLWSTFEHVDNVPTMKRPVSKAKYNYFIPDCEDCNAVNQPPAQPWNPEDPPVSEDRKKDRSQIKRAIAIHQDTEAMNAQVQTELLAGTVWANYQLVSTQWPTSPTAPDAAPTAATNWCSAINEADKSGNPAPAFLANTTLETYIQGTVPQASSSCINCHLNATMTDGQFSDFTYLLERAQGPQE
jgi:hypothetical protein